MTKETTKVKVTLALLKQEIEHIRGQQIDVKTDTKEIKDLIIQNNIKTSAIEQHLRDLNGRVSMQETTFNEHKKEDSENLRLIYSKFNKGVFVLISLLLAVLGFFLKPFFMK